MEYSAVNFKEKLEKFTEHWYPKIIAQMNDYHFKVIKLQGDFVWHNRAHTDEIFIVLNGEMKIDFRDSKVKLKTGEMLVVPKGVEHKPLAEKECQVFKSVSKIFVFNIAPSSKHSCLAIHNFL
jgi:mannose-6-phosphate isomerase-like protein (cupin superfamily)